MNACVFRQSLFQKGDQPVENHLPHMQLISVMSMHDDVIAVDRHFTDRLENRVPAKLGSASAFPLKIPNSMAVAKDETD